MKKTGIFIAVGLSVMLFNGCTSSSGIDMSSQTPSFQQGAKDGCDTAKGEYTKDHSAFKQDQQYNDGWFYGRKKCNPSDARK